MNYAKLRGKIKECYKTQGNFANALGIDESTLSAKLNNGSDWNRSEIELACALLQIPITSVYVYFFEDKVGKTQPSE